MNGFTFSYFPLAFDFFIDQHDNNETNFWGRTRRFSHDHFCLPLNQL